MKGRSTSHFSSVFPYFSSETSHDFVWLFDLPLSKKKDIRYFFSRLKYRLWFTKFSRSRKTYPLPRTLVSLSTPPHTHVCFCYVGTLDKNIICSNLYTCIHNPTPTPPQTQGLPYRPLNCKVHRYTNQSSDLRKTPVSYNSTSRDMKHETYDHTPFRNGWHWVNKQLSAWRSTHLRLRVGTLDVYKGSIKTLRGLLTKYTRIFD